MYLEQPSLESRRARADMIFLYKIVNNTVDINLQQYFVNSINLPLCDRSLRGNVRKLVVPKPRSDMLKFSFFYRAIILWNSLSSHVVNTGSLNLFKARLLEYLYLYV